MNRHFNISDISKLAGVSKATVSRVINESAKVSPETKKKVLSVILEHQYEPSKVARSLSINRTSTIGVILEEISNPFFMEVGKGIESVLQQNGYTMFISSSNWIPERELELTKLLIGHRVDGILITPINEKTESIEILKRRKIPFIIMNCHSVEGGSVSTDNVTGGVLAARHLIDTGHRRLLCLEGFKHQTANERVRGFMGEVEKHRKISDLEKAPVIEATIIRGINRNSDGYAVTDDIAANYLTPGVPTGIFALNDFVAMGVIQGLLDKGIRVPEDVSVIGYDDIMFAGQFKLPLTTIHQAKHRMGKIAAHELLDAISDRGRVPLSTVLHPMLVKRETTKDWNSS